MKLFFLKSNNDFVKVISSKKRSFTAFSTIYTIYNNLDNDRYGISISKKVSKKAVERNLIKRQIKSIIYQIEKSKSNQKDIKKKDIVIVVNNKYKNFTYQQIQDVFNKILNKGK